MDEFLVVSYPTRRTVYIGPKDDPTEVGETNSLLILPRRRYTVHLGEPEDYHPAKQIVVLKDTRQDAPKVVAFLPNATVAGLAADAPSDT